MTYCKLLRYHFNIFNESTDNDPITAILTCSDTNPRFNLKNVDI